MEPQLPRKSQERQAGLVRPRSRGPGQDLETPCPPAQHL